MKMPETPEQRKKRFATVDKYQKENIYRLTVKFNRRTEPEIYDMIMSIKNRQGYILNLVREDLERRKLEAEQ